MTEESLGEISRIFCGDVHDLYKYKSGPELVRFFNKEYGDKDVYRSGFITRWKYVYNKCIDFLNKGTFDKFLSKILNVDYLIVEQKLDRLLAIQQKDKILIQMNSILSYEKQRISENDGKFSLVKINDDLIFVGEGGFAIVYEQKSTGQIIKKLKESFWTDSNIRSRFKREYEIMKDLKDLYGIIDVYSYSDINFEYTMEKAELTLYEYVTKNTLNQKIKINCIRKILHIVKSVHEKGIIHRDLSPNNILIVSGELKISDFGLGKDLNIFHSHRTLLTTQLGQIQYCAPEQFMLLREGDKKSDIYSLGKIINFIMTGEPNKENHLLIAISKKATNSDRQFRFSDIQEMIYYCEQILKNHSNSVLSEDITDKMVRGMFSSEVEMYIYSLESEQIVKNIIAYSESKYNDSLISFMCLSDSHAEFIINAAENLYSSVCNKFEEYDSIASLMSNILKENMAFHIKEKAAIILSDIAFNIGRYNAQDLIREVIDYGVEPLVEQMLKSKLI